jgi:hypothetical protein
MTLEKDFEKIMANYEQYKDCIGKTSNTTFNTASTKKFVWGYPKQNPNIAKKYYSKKDKK